MSSQPPPYTTVQSDEKHGPPAEGPGGYGAQGSSYPPPEQQGYPPQQGGYPPQQGGYPPQQGGYPPQQGGYPPPQQGYPQGQSFPPGGAGGYAPVVMQQPTTVVVVTNVQFREAPVNTVCSSCKQQVVSRTTFENGTLTWLICAGLCVFGCNLGCCFIPFCVDGCKDVLHHCPNCNVRLGRFSRI